MKSKQEILDKLDLIIGNESNQWLEESDMRFANKAWLQNSQAVALNILRSIRAKGVNQKDLAELLDVSPQQVNKWVKGNENFTFETISKIEKALGIKLISVSELSQRKENFNKVSFKSNMEFDVRNTDIPTNGYISKNNQTKTVKIEFERNKPEYFNQKLG